MVEQVRGLSAAARLSPLFAEYFILKSDRLHLSKLVGGASGDLLTGFISASTVLSSKRALMGIVCVRLCLRVRDSIAARVIRFHGFSGESHTRPTFV